MGFEPTGRLLKADAGEGFRVCRKRAQRRFAVAVLAQQRDAVVGIEAQRHARQNGLARLVAHGSLVQGEERRTGFDGFGDAARSPNTYCAYAEKMRDTMQRPISITIR